MFSKFSVKKPYTVAVGVVAAILLGVISFSNMTTDLLPSMELPYVVIVTQNIGASPEEIESSITRPIEAGMSTIGNIKNVTSTSSENISQVILEFNDGTNMDTAMIDITMKMDQIAPSFPSEARAPTIVKINPDMMPVMIAAIEVEGKDIHELSDYVTNNLTSRFEAIDGVGSVGTNGLIEQEVTLKISQDKVDELNSKILREVDSELADVEDKLKEGEGQLRDAKNQLARQGREGILKIDSALEQLRDGREQMQTSLSQLTSQRGSIAEQQAEAIQGKEVITGALSQLPDAMTDRQREELKRLRGAVLSFDSQIEDKKREREAVNRQIDELVQSVGQSGGGQSFSELNRERDRITGEIEALEASKSDIIHSESYVGLEAYEAAGEKRAQLEAQLTAIEDALAQFEAGLMKLDEAIAQLQSGTIPAGTIPGVEQDANVDELEEQLLKTRSDAETMIGDASKQIEDAQAELAKMRKEFEEQRDDALKAAKIDGIITPQLISQILGAENFQMPAGYIEEEGQTYLVRVGEKYKDLDGIRDMLLFSIGLDTVDEIRVFDVADVGITDNADSTYSKLNGHDGVMMTFQKQSTFSTADVSSRIKAEFDKVAGENPDIRIVPLLDQGIYIDMIIDSVLSNLLYGAILAVLVLLIFLGDFRPTIIIAFSIPISVVVAFVAMYFTGVTLNMISLAGLALGVGMLVDNSIVVIENIYRLYGNGLPLPKACVAGAKQMSAAIFSSTLTTICVFLPIVFITGIARQLFADMGLTIAYSLLASLVVALTLVPAMSASLLKRQKERKHRIFGAIQRGYAWLLRYALRAKVLVLGVSLILLVWSVMQISSMNTQFMPSMDSNQMTATLALPDDATFEESTQMADKLLDELITFDDIDSIGVFTGGRLLGGLSGGSSSSSITYYIMLKEGKAHKNEELARMMEEKTKRLNYEVTFSTSNMDISMLYGSGISVSVKGPEIGELRRISSDIAGVMASVEGTVNVSDGQEKTVPELEIIVDKEKAIADNLTVAQIYQFVAMKISDGTEITKLNLENKEFPVIVVDEASLNRTRDEIEDLYITVTKGDETYEVRLGDVAKIGLTDSLESIRRSGQQRVLSASCEIDADHNIGKVGAEISEKLAGYSLPEGYTITESGENDAINSTLSDLAWMIVAAVALIYLIMVAQFQSLLSPFIVLLTIPLAFTGGLLALIFTGMEISMVAMLGFLMLSGVVVNNGIVFVDTVNQMRLAGMEKREALVEAGTIRLRPILMTALTTILGMSIMALGQDMGSEMMQPMAVVTIGGLSYATFMTLFVVPVLYDLFNRRKKMKVIDVDLSENEMDKAREGFA